MKFVSLLAISLFLFSCGNDEAGETVSNKDNVIEENPEVVSDLSNDLLEDTAATVFESTYDKETFFTEGIGWGYRILVDGKTFINQPHIPAIQGNKGFSSEEKAMITADFAIEKIKNGISPPTISPEELETLGVLN